MSREERIKRPSKNIPTKPKMPDIPQWLKADYDCSIRLINSNIYAIRNQWVSVFDKACEALRIVHAGVGLATSKGKDLIPHPALALSIALADGAFTQCELDFSSAIAFLRREAIALPNETPRGYVLVTHKDMPLGFVKNIGNRANNLYPQEWRIKSTHIPQPQQIIKLK